MRELALFAGAGGGILGGKLLGWRCVCAVERDPYAASVLMDRQNDGTLDPFPVWDDVCTFDGRPWRSCVDVISGGFPCQDISVAGSGAGIDGERSGLWAHMARVVGEVRPRFVLVENSPALTSRGLGRVLGDLAALGYDAEWGVFGAHHAGAPHERERIWIIASDAHRDRVRDEHRRGPGATAEPSDDGVARHDSNAQRARLEGAARQGLPRARRAGVESAGSRGEASLPNAEGRGQVEAGDAGRTGAQQPFAGSGSEPGWWDAEPGLVRVVHGMAHRVDRIKALGNGQVPAVVALAWRELTGRAGWK